MELSPACWTVLRSNLDPPWSLRIEDQAPLTVMAIVRGDAWVLPDGGEPVAISPDDVAVFRGPDPYTVTSHPMITATSRDPAPPGIRRPSPLRRSARRQLRLRPAHLGQHRRGLDGAADRHNQLDGEVSQRLLRGLPSLIMLRAQDWNSPIISLLAAEIVKDAPGQEAVLDRLLDLLLIAVLRA